MMPSAKTIRIVVFTCCASVISTVSLAQSLYIPDKLYTANYTDYGDIFPTTIEQTFVQNGTPTTLTNQFFANVTPFPTSYTHAESGITGCCAPVSEEGGVFERNEHVARLATASENNQGHLFQRREAWDIAFNLKIETPNVAPRKEAGLYFKSPGIGNALFNVTSNDGFYTTAPGTIGVVFTGVIPDFTFSGGGGPLGDYNHNGTVDAADYVVWRETLGSTTDLRPTAITREQAWMSLTKPTTMLGVAPSEKEKVATADRITTWATRSTSD